MENPKRQQPEPQILSASSSGRRSSVSNSPEFEFWMLRNPSFPQPNLLSADELFVDGVLLPLYVLHHHHHSHSDDPPHLPPQPFSASQANSAPPQNREPESEPASRSVLVPSDSLTTTLAASKRWRDIFKKSDRKNLHNHEDKEKEKKKERRGGGGSSAELNINIWPFSRSRSAGNGGGKPRMGTVLAATRKVSSAPCSRSNSAGESKSRKWPSSPSRAGVHLGRSSPVWQARRGGSCGRSYEPVVRNTEKGIKKEESETGRSKTASAGDGGSKAKVLNLNVPMCIGYHQHLSCRSVENSAVVVAAHDSDATALNGGVGSGDGGRGSNLFNLRSLFTKKVY